MVTGRPAFPFFCAAPAAPPLQRGRHSQPASEAWGFHTVKVQKGTFPGNRPLLLGSNSSEGPPVVIRGDGMAGSTQGARQGKPGVQASFVACQPGAREQARCQRCVRTNAHATPRGRARERWGWIIDGGGSTSLGLRGRSPTRPPKAVSPKFQPPLGTPNLGRCLTSSSREA